MKPTTTAPGKAKSFLDRERGSGSDVDLHVKSLRRPKSETPVIACLLGETWCGGRGLMLGSACLDQTGIHKPPVKR